MAGEGPQRSLGGPDGRGDAVRAVPSETTLFTASPPIPGSESQPKSGGLGTKVALLESPRIAEVAALVYRRQPMALACSAWPTGCDPGAGRRYRRWAQPVIPGNQRRDLPSFGVTAGRRWDMSIRRASAPSRPAHFLLDRDRGW